MIKIQLSVDFYRKVQTPWKFLLENTKSYFPRFYYVNFFNLYVLLLRANKCFSPRKLSVYREKVKIFLFSYLNKYFYFYFQWCTVFFEASIASFRVLRYYGATVATMATELQHATPDWTRNCSTPHALVYGYKIVLRFVYTYEWLLYLFTYIILYLIYWFANY